MSDNIAQNDINRAEYILRSCFEAQLLAGDQRGIHERLERILPPGAYTLCNLIRQHQPGNNSGNYSSRNRPLPEQRPRAPNRHRPYNRRDTRGSTSRDSPITLLDSPSTQKYLDPQQQAALKQLQLEKERRDKAAEFAKTASLQIKEEVKRLAEAAQLNLEQEVLDRRRERLNRPPSTFRIPKLTDRFKDLGLTTTSEEEDHSKTPIPAIEGSKEMN